MVAFLQPFRMLLLVLLLGVAACDTSPLPTLQPTLGSSPTTLPPTQTAAVTITPPSSTLLPTSTSPGAATATETLWPTLTPTLSPTFTVTPLPTLTSTPRPTATPLPTFTPTFTPSPTATLTPTVDAVGAGFNLGAHVIGFGNLALMRSTGMTWFKLQVRWDGATPASAAKPLIDTARFQNFKILLSVVGDPAQLGANRPAYIAAYSGYLAALATYGPDAIEVWNEPNIDREWPRGQISGSIYTELLASAYTAVKQVNPNIMIISGAPAPTGYFGGRCAAEGCDDNIFIQQMQQAGAAKYLDCVGMHYNDGIVSPDRTSGDPRGSSDHYSRYFKTLTALYASTFPGKRLCFTEIGYLSSEGFGYLPAGFEWAANTTVRNQADWLALAASIARADSRIRLLIIWNMDALRYDTDPQAGYAIIRPDASCPACATLRTVMSG